MASRVSPSYAYELVEDQFSGQKSILVVQRSVVGTLEQLWKALGPFHWCMTAHARDCCTYSHGNLRSFECHLPSCRHVLRRKVGIMVVVVVVVLVVMIVRY